MYKLCIYNTRNNKFFYEHIDSPYLLKRRLNSLKRSKKLQLSYCMKNY